MTDPLYRSWVGAGIAAGCLAALSPGSVFMALAALVAAIVLARVVGAQNRRFLLVLFFSALVLRVGVSAGLDALSWQVEGERPYQDHDEDKAAGWDLHIHDKTRGYLKIGDSDYFSQRGYATARFAEGSNEPVLPFRVNQYGKHGYVFCIGWFYHLFGFSPCAVKLINCLLGSLMAVLVFLLGQRCFGTVPARWAGILTAVFPSLVLWSATNLKDIPLTFFTLLVLMLHSQLIQTKNARYRLVLFLVLLGSLQIHATFRSSGPSVLLAGSLFVAYLLPLSLRARPAWTFIALWALLGLGVVLSCSDPVGYRIRQMLMQALNWHVGFTTTPGSSYAFLPAQFYQGGYRWEWVETGRMNLAILLGMGQGVLHYLLEPFPWKISNVFQGLCYPQLIVWYALLPFTWMGFLLGLRKKEGGTLALVLVAATFTVMGSLTSGNIGTLFRQRDMVTPLFLILGCAGLHQAIAKPYLQGSRILKLLSPLWRTLRERFEKTVQRTAQMLRNGPAGQAWRDYPLRSIGVLGITALVTHGLLTRILLKTPTPWICNARMMFGALALLALCHRGSWEQVREGSRVLRFLRRA